MMPQEAAQSEERYVSLCERAMDFVRSKGGMVHEDMLIGYVFGSSGTPSFWRPLLRTLLAAEDRLVFHANGQWCLPALERPDSSLIDEFVAIDVETTGLKPRQQRIIEIALIRYRCGKIERSFETLLNPGRPIPQFISKLTTIANEHVRMAPTFDQVADRIVEFIGDSLIIGHNVGFDIGFVNAELERIQKPPIVNERLDTMGLAVRLLPSLRKPSLDRVAAAVGLSPRTHHRAGADARLTAEVAHRLVSEGVRQGINGIDQLKASATVLQPRPRDDIGRARSVLDRSLAHAMPKKPGVYLMKDARGEIVYIGKAKNLRDRVSSYYSQPIGYTRKMDGLIEAVTRIDHEVVGSELEALLLESQLIRRLQPRYNTALKRSEHLPYIKVDTMNPWPRVQLATQRKHDGARYFGPYRNASSARKTVDVINSVLPLRTCTRSFNNARSYGKPCIALDLGQCLGPCTGRADRDEYRSVVNDVIRFLEGMDDVLYRRLLAELERAASRLDFEKATRLRKDIRALTTIIDEQTRLRESELLHNLLVVLPSADQDCREVLIVLKGRLWAQLRVNRLPGLETAQRTEGAGAEASLISRAVGGCHEELFSVAARLERSLERSRAAAPGVPDHYSVDDANTLNRWLFRNAGHPALIAIPLTDDGLPAADAHELAYRVLSINDETLMNLDIRRVSDGHREADNGRRTPGAALQFEDSPSEVM